MLSRSVCFGPFRFDLETNVLLRDEDPVPIGHRAAALLRILLSEHGKVVSRADLMEAVWPGLALEDSNLSVQIASLRKALGTSATGEEWVATVPRLGYRFVGKLTESGGEASSSSHPDKWPMPSEHPSIAVLPFSNLSSDADQAYFADGLADDIITGLSRLRWLLVIARNSSFTFREKGVDFREIGRELAARYILDGSVRRSGDHIRVSAQMIEASTAAQIWSERYDCEVVDIFAVQDQITQAVVASIEPHLYAAEGFRLQSKAPESLDAWGFVMRAMPYIWTWKAADNETAIEYLKRAVEIDPGYARANSLLAWAHAARLHTGWSSVRESLSLALSYARLGVEQDGDDPWGHLALGFSQSMSRQSKPAIDELTVAIEINPNFAFGHAMLGLALGYSGEPERGLDHLSLAMRLSPRDAQQARYLSCTGLCHLIAGRFERAAEFERRAVQLRPHFLGAWRSLAAAAALAGDSEVAKVALAEAHRLQPDLSVAWIEAHIPIVHARDRDMYVNALKIAGLA
jgi:TolB-like protein/tetratricopeptide (TPR) repeat protein